MQGLHHQRSYDGSLPKKLWEQYPLIAHLIISALVGAFVLGGTYFEFTAHAETLIRHDKSIESLQNQDNILNEKLTRIDQKTDDLVNFFNLGHGPKGP
jgi:hypothetical protein